MEMFSIPRDCQAWNRRYAGTEALGNVGVHGYLVGKLLGRTVQAHRVIWLLLSGAWPKEQVDHIDGNTLNNRKSNLRAVDRFENAKNAKLNANNTSGASGVRLTAQGRWQAKITVNRKRICLGTFDTFEEAKATRLAANAKYGFSPRHGQPAPTPETTNAE
jgi:hypothetical protein